MHLSESTLPFTLIDYSASLIVRILLLLALLLIAPFVAGCHSTDKPAARSAAFSSAAPVTITLSSSSLAGGTFPKEFTCDGADRSPQLQWTAPPPETRSLVLTITDPDVPDGTFTHWVAYNLPANTTALPAGLPTLDHLSDGTRQGRNDFGKIGFAGPCGPHGSTHRYFFDLFALKSTLDLPAGATRAQVEDAMNTYVVARGKLMARYSR